MGTALVFEAALQNDILMAVELTNEWESNVYVPTTQVFLEQTSSAGKLCVIAAAAEIRGKTTSEVNQERFPSAKADINFYVCRSKLAVLVFNIEAEGFQPTVFHFSRLPPLLYK